MIYLLTPNYIVTAKNSGIYQAEVTSGRSVILIIVVLFSLIFQNPITIIVLFFCFVFWTYKREIVFNLSDQQYAIRDYLLFIVIRKRVILLNSITELRLSVETGGDGTTVYETCFHTVDKKRILLARRNSIEQLKLITHDIEMYLPKEVKINIYKEVNQ